MKKFFVAGLVSAFLAQGAFAQEALRNAVDSNNWKKVRKIVDSGEMEEIYWAKCLQRMRPIFTRRFSSRCRMKLLLLAHRNLHMDLEQRFAGWQMRLMPARV